MPITLARNIGQNGSRFTSALNGAAGAVRIVSGVGRIALGGLIVDSLPRGVSTIVVRDASGESLLSVYGISTTDEHSVALAGLAKASSDSQMRAAIGSAPTLSAGLQAIGLMDVAPPAPSGNSILPTLNIGQARDLLLSPLSGVIATDRVRVLSGRARVGAGAIAAILPFGVSEIVIRRVSQSGTVTDAQFALYGVNQIDEYSAMLAIAASGRTDAQVRSQIASAASLVDGLGSIGLVPVDNPIVPPIAVPDFVEITGQRFAVIPDTARPLNLYILQPETIAGETGWYRIEARSGDRNSGDANNVRRVGLDGFVNDVDMRPGAETELRWSSIYEEGCFATKTGDFFNPFELHTHRDPAFPAEFETAGPARLSFEPTGNGPAVRFWRNDPVLDGTGAMTGVSPTFFTFPDGFFVAGQRYDFICQFRIGGPGEAVNGYLRLFVNGQLMVNHAGKFGNGYTRGMYWQLRVYCNEDRPINPVHHVRPISRTSTYTPVPMPSITDTYDGTGANPAGYRRTQTGTGATSTLSGGAWTVATGASPSGNNRWTRPLTAAKSDGITRYEVQIDYQATGGTLLTAAINQRGDGTLSFLTLEGGGNQVPLNSATSTTATFTFTIPQGLEMPYLLFTAPATANRSITITETRIRELA